MNKFDQLLSEITNNTNMSNNNNTQNNNNNNQNNSTPNQNNKPVVTPTLNNNQQKPNLNQLMKDFNDPTKKINNLSDLKNYGINVDQK